MPQPYSPNFPAGGVAPAQAPYPQAGAVTYPPAPPGHQQGGYPPMPPGHQQGYAPPGYQQPGQYGPPQGGYVPPGFTPQQYQPPVMHQPGQGPPQMQVAPGLNLFRIIVLKTGIDVCNISCDVKQIECNESCCCLSLSIIYKMPTKHTPTYKSRPNETLGLCSRHDNDNDNDHRHEHCT